MRITAGIITCNEEQTIGPLLERLAGERGNAFTLDEILVVSAACRDGTDGTVTRFAARDPRVRLIAEPERRGKSAAVNTFLAARGESDLTLLTSGDVLPESGFLGLLAGAFSDPKTGMAGGQPVPVNARHSFLGRMAGLLWGLHHKIALQSPKLGETIIFRSALVPTIPEDSPVDEASIEALIQSRGYALRYVPDAIIHNRGPDTLREWLSQRRRIAYGHAWLERSAGHHVSTRAAGRAAPLLAGHLLRHPADLPVVAALVACEWIAKQGAKRDARNKRDHRVWELARSTKNFSA